MATPQTETQPRIEHENPWFDVVFRDGFYCVERKSPHVVQVLGITDDQKVPMIRQFRVPANSYVFELPAGIDDKQYEDATTDDERLKRTALEELDEECGFSASHIQKLWSGPKSAGLANEYMHVFLAHQLTREHAGGGVGREDIEVHLVDFHALPQFVLERSNCGIAVLNAYALAVAAANAGQLPEDLASIVLGRRGT